MKCNSGHGAFHVANASECELDLTFAIEEVNEVDSALWSKQGLTAEVGESGGEGCVYLRVDMSLFPSEEELASKG